MNFITTSNAAVHRHDVDSPDVLEGGARSRYSMTSIVGLFTDLLPAGGVQLAGRHVAAVASAFGAQRGIPCLFPSLNDPQGLHPRVYAPVRFLFPASHGANRNSCWPLYARRAANHPC